MLAGSSIRGQSLALAPTARQKIAPDELTGQHSGPPTGAPAHVEHRLLDEGTIRALAGAIGELAAD
jgi:hypothetical protein